MMLFISCLIGFLLVLWDSFVLSTLTCLYLPEYGLDVHPDMFGIWFFIILCIRVARPVHHKMPANPYEMKRMQEDSDPVFVILLSSGFHFLSGLLYLITGFVFHIFWY